MKNVILTTGVYDLIKDHIRRKKVNKEQEAFLINELKSATQIVRREVPENVVVINSKLKVLDQDTNQEFEVTLVGPSKVKVSKNRLSILSDIGLATVGRKVGEIISWPTEQAIKQYKILAVQAL